jgi:hypothetical protein
MYRPAPRPLMLVFPTRASDLIASISERGGPLPRRPQLKAPAIGHVIGHLAGRNVVDDQGIGSMCVDPS